MGRALFGSVSIRDALDVFEARWLVRRSAMAIGFSTRDAGELILVASELATNILKFAPPGVIESEQIESSPHGVGIRIVARDAGAPLVDLERIVARSAQVGVAMEWTGRGLGGGLGAVYRFTDALRCEPCATGKQLVAERYLHRPRRR
jgi:anti-sigma regulatory factor (Ser/Thr protein kinase)